MMAAASPTPEFVSYEIELVAMPEPESGAVVVEAPPAPPEEAAPPPPEPAPQPEGEPEPESEPEEPRPRPPSRPDPEPTAADDVNVRIEGLRRDYPLYYENIITQIQRCFRWTGSGTPATEVYFVIEDDGSVRESRFLRRSGNPAFDYTTMEAVVECAGQGRFGPLPEDLPYERLPIRFTFRPGSASGIFR